jgi:hypothetical protein
MPPDEEDADPWFRLEWEDSDTPDTGDSPLPCPGSLGRCEY